MLPRGGTADAPGSPNPRASVEIGIQTRNVIAWVAGRDERDRLWEAQKTSWPGFAEYERTTDRQIPVVILEPVP